MASVCYLNSSGLTISLKFLVIPIENPKNKSLRIYRTFISPNPRTPRTKPKTTSSASGCVLLNKEWNAQSNASFNGCLLTQMELHEFIYTTFLYSHWGTWYLVCHLYNFSMNDVYKYEQGIMRIKVSILLHVQGKKTKNVHQFRLCGQVGLNKCNVRFLNMTFFPK